jgi:hypothetical protein
VIKKLRGRTVTKIERPPDPGMVRLVLDDTTTLEVPADTWALYRNIEIRRHTRAVIEPLARDGIDIVRISMQADAEPDVTIDKGDLPSYAVAEGEAENLLEQVQELYVELISVAFRSGNKWRLGIGEYTFWATVLDYDFLERVEEGEEAFRKGDVLRCRIEIIQTRDAEGLHSEHRVLEVLEHRPASRQLSLSPPPAPPEEEQQA